MVMNWYVYQTVLALLWHMGNPQETLFDNNEQFRLPGDYIIGGLFSLHSRAINLDSRTKPEFITCDSFYPSGYRYFLTMIFAIDEINQATDLLPGVQLGYEVYDSCMEMLGTVPPSLRFVSKGNSNGVAVQCDYMDYQPHVIAVVGPTTSEETIPIARLLGHFHIPQIGYSASSETLTNRQRFPTFFRMIPSDNVQTEAILQLLHQLGWNWVSLLCTDDEYGRGGCTNFINLAEQHSICISHWQLLPQRVEAKSKAQLGQILSTLKSVQSNSTVLFANELYATALLQEAVSQGYGSGKVWIGSEGWTASRRVADIPNVGKAGGVLGLALQKGRMPGFEPFLEKWLKRMSSRPQQECQAGGDLSQGVCFPNCAECYSFTLQNYSYLLGGTQRRTSFATYASVYVIAHALHSLLQCNQSGCLKSKVCTQKLVEELWRVNFTLETSPISFNSKGDPPSIYEIVNWQWHQDGAPSIVTVGKYSNGKLSIDLPNVYWNTPDNRPPGSNCSSQCEDGQVKRGSGCCSKCDDCPAGTFSNVSDDSNICSPCPLEQWSYPRSSNCRDRIVEMRSWTDFSTIFLLFFSILAMAVLLSVALVFLCQHQSHMVHEAGGASCFLMLLSIFSSCTSLPFFLGPPSPSTCLVRQPFFSSGFTVCIAAMLAWPLRPPHSSTLCCQVSLQSCTGRILVFTISLLPQVVNFFLWLWLTPPAVIPNYDILDNLVLLECFEGSNIFFGFSICYNCILAALALALTVGRLDLWSYNTGRQATFSLSVFIISWIFFLPTYATSKGLNVPCIQVFSGLVCIYSIQGSYFLPKCRLLLFKPHIGTNGFLPRASLDQPDSIRTVDSQ
uniref:Taste receptor type 1 member 3 n=1 Tax=Erpetoichthys calabaricus TaxID=27687 RepID=A0A8C4RK74_ERPCA